MTTTTHAAGCPVHRRFVIDAAEAGRPSSSFYAAVHRIAGRVEADAIAAFLRDVKLVRGQIDMRALEAALRSGDTSAVLTAMRINTPATVTGLQTELRRVYAAVGRVSADVLSDALGMEFAFQAVDPNAVLFARRSSSTLVTRITEQQRLTVQAIIGLGQSEGVTITGQARLIEQTVGLRHDWARAPLNLARELRDGHAAAATSRRLSAVDKQRIRSAVKRGAVTEDFVSEMQEKYTASLRRRRALDIARTETLRSGNAAVQGSWSEARRRGVLPQTARRFWIVTPDDRLRETHAAVPDMNPDGVAIDDAFETPVGMSMYPPLEPLCRCSVGLLMNPSSDGVIV